MIVLSAYQARPLLAALAEGRSEALSSPDLGRSEVVVRLGPQGADFVTEVVGVAELERIARAPRKAFAMRGGAAEPIQTFSETTGWPRSLRPTRTAPTALVSGFPMHRIEGTDPVRDTLSKLDAIGRIRGRVLDTATGLGYTAIEAARTAARVLTVELDPAAIELARLNPWSRELFEFENIEVRLADVAELAPELPSAHFEAVLHDPPTLALAGDLYAEAFYRELRRVLRRGGRLFHYVGDPASAASGRLYPGVRRRLAAAGFKRVEVCAEAFGLVACAE